MTKVATDDSYGELSEPATLTIHRLLPGPVERAWAYLTDSDLRRQWLAAGDMELKVGAPFEFVWRNDELSDPPGNDRKASLPSTECKARLRRSMLRTGSRSPGKVAAT